MRTISMLIGLIFSVTVIVAQEAVEPTPHLVNPICDYYFAQASAAIRDDLSGREASTDPRPELPAESTPTEPGTIASPPPLASQSFLDDAIRSCSGLEDFAGASAAHPDVLGSVDPIDFLVARCHEPGTELARYAPCVWMERALATPTPEPTATPLLSKPDIERELAKAIRGATWEPYRESRSGAAFGPFDSGARTGIIFDDLEQELDRSVDSVVLVHFDDVDDLVRHWQDHAAAASEAPEPERPCVNGRPGRGTWEQGEFFCFVSKQGNALMRWTNERTGTYGVMDAVAGNKDLRALYRQWRPVAHGTAAATGR